jgi:hypothetical protein
MAGENVQALRDFTYDADVGLVRTGQVFKLKGHPNDAGLLRHGFVIAFAGKAADLVQDDRGRKFVEEWQRERAGREDERPVAEVVAERRQRVYKRVMTVGA